MILINNYKVDMPDNVNAKYAIFTIEFEKDNRLYVGHVLNRTVISAVASFILNAMDEYSQMANSQISKAIRESEFITVEIIAYNIYNTAHLFKCKYDTILKNQSYIPYGYNSINLSCSKSRDEKKVINDLLKEYPELRSYSSCKPIYRIDPKTGESILFNSAKEAADYMDVCASNISACCKGSLHTAYGYGWCYADSLNNQ